MANNMGFDNKGAPASAPRAGQRLGSGPKPQQPTTPQASQQQFGPQFASAPAGMNPFKDSDPNASGLVNEINGTSSPRPQPQAQPKPAAPAGNTASKPNTPAPVNPFQPSDPSANKLVGEINGGASSSSQAPASPAMPKPGQPVQATPPQQQKPIDYRKIMGSYDQNSALDRAKKQHIDMMHQQNPNVSNQQIWNDPGYGAIKPIMKKKPMPQGLPLHMNPMLRTQGNLI